LQKKRTRYCNTKILWDRQSSAETGKRSSAGPQKTRRKMGVASNSRTVNLNELNHHLFALTDSPYNPETKWVIPAAAIFPSYNNFSELLPLIGNPLLFKSVSLRKKRKTRLCVPRWRQHHAKGGLQKENSSSRGACVKPPPRSN